ncbi:DUF6470 family protein [Herbivorax sp. ANBcel31]|uniref:DUF6470 family protein n=1 Tax=Herbivorax sp. ANBcel31 TaxID=3069754 RepID=UPI0027B6C6F0|nr:DUF6470 family protein [Herbivorax sp. ANBcel31]MDQ2085102.1 DUF6470 family protein [Herbivorax sp. ANBcel31]
MDISINTTHARLGIETTPARLETKTDMARLELKQNHAKMKIKTEPPKVKIDQYEAFASAGLKKPLDLTKENAQISYQKVMEYIARKASDGDRLAAIHKGGDPIVEFAKRASYTKKDFNIDFIPKTGPEITLEEGKLKRELEGGSNVVLNSVQKNFVPQSLNSNYVSGNVNIYMQQSYSVDIEYIGNNVSQYV